MPKRQPVPRAHHARFRHLATAILLGSMATPALAQEGTLDVANAGDTAWVLACALLALFGALPGFALIACSQARGRNHATTFYQVTVVALLCCVLWFITGYTLAFGPVTGGWLGGGSAWMLLQLGNVRAATNVPESAFVLFQASSAALAVSLVCGALIGRINTPWLMTFTGLWSLVVYAPVAHWIWGGGWLSSSAHTLDWGGGIVVQVTAGLSALLMAFRAGPRRQTNPTPVPLAGIVMLLGTALFLIGRLAIAGGSAMAANDDAAAAVLASLAGAASGALVWPALCRIRGHQVSPFALARGVLSGLATIAPATGYVSPGAALVIGGLGTAACYFAASLLRRGTDIDDSADIFAIFGVGGIVGALLLAPFLSTHLGGTGLAPGLTLLDQLAAQALGTTATAIWALVASLVLATIVSLVFPMRVAADREEKGLDAA